VIPAVLTAAASLTAQQLTPASNQNHLVVAADDARTLQTALDRASSAGLHVLFGRDDGVFLSRAQAPDAPGVYRAIRENSSDRLERALNAAGAQSFRLIPTTLTRSEGGTTAVAQRAAGVTTSYRYRVIPADGMEPDARDLAMNGFSIVGVFTQQSGMATVLGRPGRLHVVLEASADPSTANGKTASGSQYRVVSALRASTLETEVNQAAAEGYHVVGGSFMNVLLEKRAGSRPDRVYRVVGAIRGTTMQQEVDEAGRAGFHAVPSAIMNNPNSKAETVIVMERTPSGPRHYEYVWIRSSKMADFSPLATWSAGGYEPIALWRFRFVPVDEFGNRPDASTDDYFVLLQRRRQVFPPSPA
jgi:hypothetical protein